MTLRKTLNLYDSHLHIIDKRFPLISNNGFLPKEFTCEDYLKRMQNYKLCGGVIVSGSFQGFDQSYLIDSLDKLGSSYVGVTQVSNSISDNEIMELNKIGVRAIRFNLKRGGSEELKYLDRMARRVYEMVGWHVELYVESKNLTELYQTLIELPAVCIDHLGLTAKGLKILLQLVEHGVYIKSSGFGRVDFNVCNALQELYSANPQSLMFGTDLPSTRAARVYNDDDFNLVIDAFSTEQAKNILYKNAINFYKPIATA